MLILNCYWVSYMGRNSVFTSHHLSRNPILIRGFPVTHPTFRQSSTTYWQQTCVYDTEITSNSYTKQYYWQINHDDGPQLSVSHQTLSILGSTLQNTHHLIIFILLYDHPDNTRTYMILKTSQKLCANNDTSILKHYIIGRACWRSSYVVTLNPIMMGRFLRLHLT